MWKTKFQNNDHIYWHKQLENRGYAMMSQQALWHHCITRSAREAILFYWLEIVYKHFSIFQMCSTFENKKDTFLLVYTKERSAFIFGLNTHGWMHDLLEFL